jgi:two-component system, NarL family, response regulator NreC
MGGRNKWGVNMKTRILIADDDKYARRAARLTVKDEPDMEVVGEAENGFQAEDLAVKTRPDVILMDIEMKGMDGITATRHLTEKCPASKIIAFSGHAKAALLEDILKAGAVGYVCKLDDRKETVEAIKEVMNGRVYFSETMRLCIRDSIVSSVSRSDTSSINVLTEREREVLKRIAAGCSTKEIADDLKISVRTVEDHRQSIMRKLNKHSIADLTRVAAHAGVLSI